MELKRYQWMVSSKGPDGHAQGYLEGGMEDDPSRAVELAQEAVERLQSQGLNGWYVGVQDTHTPILSSNPPTYSYKLIFFEEG